MVGCSWQPAILCFFVLCSFFVLSLFSVFCFCFCFVPLLSASFCCFLSSDVFWSLDIIVIICKQIKALVLVQHVNVIQRSPM